MSIYITTKGIVSSIGNNVEENLHAFQNLKHGISKATLVQDIRKDSLVGEVKLSNDDLISELGLSKEKDWSRTALLALKAAKEAFASQVQSSELKTGVISATSVGGMDRSEIYYKDIFNGKTSDLNLLKTHDLGDSSEVIAKYLGVEGFISTISTACSSGINAIMLGTRMIEEGLLDSVIVGGVDPLSDFTINGFKSLKIYDEEWCRPMDDSRVGLNLGEAAGFLLLENDKSIASSKNKVLAEVIGYANANDAYHQTASSPDGKGATLAITEAIKVQIKESQAAIAKYKEQQNNVRNNREYDSISKEIEFQGLEIQLGEKKIKEAKFKIESKKEVLDECKAKLDGRKEDLAAKKAELDEIISETQKDEEAFVKKSATARKKIEERLLKAYDRLRDNSRNGLAVVSVSRDACGGCFNKIPPQRQLDIEAQKKVIVCEHCGRILIEGEEA